jgi:hypothetical protein
MRTHLEFMSDQFEVVPDEDEETNPDIFGLRLAEFVTEHLKANGYEADHIAEDWGRCVIIGNAPFSSFVGCSSYGDDTWLIQIHPDKPFVRRWFKKLDARDWVEQLAATVERALIQHGGAKNLRWWSDAESGRK